MDHRNNSPPSCPSPACMSLLMDSLITMRESIVSHQCHEHQAEGRNQVLFNSILLLILIQPCIAKQNPQPDILIGAQLDTSLPRCKGGEAESSFIEAARPSGGQTPTLSEGMTSQGLPSVSGEPSSRARTGLPGVGTSC